MTELPSSELLDQRIASLRAMPKAELHCHLDGSLRPATMLELAREQHVALPSDTESGLTQYMRASNVTSLVEYLERFETTIALMQTPDALERIARELVEDAHADGLTYIEVRNAPHLNIERGMSLDEGIEATLRGLAAGEAATGTVARYIVCSLRHYSPSRSIEAAHAAVRHRGGVVGFDIAGGEAGSSAVPHSPAFRIAKEGLVGATCHAGEAAGPESVREALFVCGAERLGHGVRTGEEPALLDYVRDHRIALELCPTSNVQTGAVASIATHPIKRYFDAGVTVTVNTDSRLISGTTVTEELARLALDLGFTDAELARCMLNAMESAFLPLPERAPLVARMRDTLSRDWGLVA